MPDDLGGAAARPRAADRHGAPVAHGPVSRLPGYAEGAWWVQDAAAALPARLLGDVRGRRVADLCAAPGGKTAQLALAGASVTAVDRSREPPGTAAGRISRGSACRPRSWRPMRPNGRRGPFDAVLLDAPVLLDRHHPPPSRRRLAQARRRPRRAAGLQRRLLDRAVALTRRAARSSTAPARSSRRRAKLRSTPCCARPRVCARRRRRRGRRTRRAASRAGGRSAHAALPPARRRSAHGRSRRLLRRPAAARIDSTRRSLTSRPLAAA